MMTTAAEKVGEKQPEKGFEKEKEKTGLRRALGRGLESLLPGPRVVARPLTVSPSSASPNSAGAGNRTTPLLAKRPDIPAVTAAPADAAPWAGGGNPVPQQVPPPEPVPVRNDMTSVEVRPATNPSSVPAQAVSDRYVRDEAENLATRDAQADTRPPANLVTNIPLADIEKNPYQTRNLFDQELLEELADSIRASGVVQPVVVRPAEEDGKYILILGERRCRASKLAGKTTVPAIVKRVSDQQAAEMTVIENLQRQDLNCLEQAEAFRVLSKEFNLTQQQIGDRVGMSRESVSNYMRLLRLPQRVLDYLGNNQMGFSEARQLLTLEDPETIAKAADEVVRKHMSIQQIEDLVIQLESLPVTGEKKGGSRWVDPNVRAAQLELERMLGLRVRIRDRKGKGKIVIEYATVDDYERVVGRLKG